MDTSKRIIKWYFYILPFIDLLTSLTARFLNISVSIGMFIKGLTILYFVFYIFFINKNKYRKISIIYYCILFLFLCLYFILKTDIWSVSNIANECTYILKIFYFPVTLTGGFNLFINAKIDSKDIEQILKKTLWIYTILLIVPYITGTGFQSYKYAGGVGNNGWFFSFFEIGAILILLFSIVYLNFKEKKVLPCIMTIIPAFAIATIGTKVSSLGALIECILLLIFLFANNSDKKIYKILVIMLVAYLFVWYSPAKSSMNSAIKRYNNNIIKQETNKKQENTKSENRQENTDKECRVPDNKEDGKNTTDLEKTEKVIVYPTVNSVIKNATVRKVISISLSERGDFLLKNNYTYVRSGLKNVLFGMGWSNRESINYTYSRKMVEIDFFDILFHYGFVGLFVYIMPLIYTLVVFFKNIKERTKDKLYYFLIFLLMCGISTLSGHIFTAPAVSIYLALLVLLMVNEREIVK